MGYSFTVYGLLIYCIQTNIAIAHIGLYNTIIHSHIWHHSSYTYNGNIDTSVHQTHQCYKIFIRLLTILGPFHFNYNNSLINKLRGFVMSVRREKWCQLKNLTTLQSVIKFNSIWNLNN